MDFTGPQVYRGLAGMYIRSGSGGKDSAERLDESLSDLGEVPDPKNSQS